MGSRENEMKLRKTALARQALWTFSLVGCLAAMPNQAWGFMTASTHESTDLAMVESEGTTSCIVDTGEGVHEEIGDQSYPPWWQEIFSLSTPMANAFEESGSPSGFEISFTVPWESNEDEAGGDFGAGSIPVLSGQQN